jgi:hypothetical protein
MNSASQKSSWNTRRDADGSSRPCHDIYFEVFKKRFVQLKDQLKDGSLNKENIAFFEWENPNEDTVLQIS